VPPLGGSLGNPEIFRRLAAAMGMTEPALYESDRAVIDHLLADSGIGLSFEELAHRGTVDFYEEPQVQFETLTFPTPSGRVELASAHALRDGHPLTAQPWYDERPAPDQLRLLSPASPWSLNDSFANEPKLAGRTGPATVTLPPGLDLRRHPAGRRLLAEGPLAAPRGAARQRQHPEPRRALGHGRLLDRPRGPGHRHPSIASDPLELALGSGSGSASRTEP
jgi:hypothetical protein